MPASSGEIRRMDYLCRSMRYFLQLSYDGGRFCGWQVQPGVVTVQQTVNDALQTLLGPGVECVGSGRTDTGVHATVQVVHIDADLPMPLDDLVYKLNAILPADIAVAWARPVRADAHARYDAISRSYQYFIHRHKDPFRAGRSYHFKPALDVEAMNSAASLLLSWDDFQCFSKVKTDVKTFECKIFEARWKSENDSLVFYVSANRFLRGMVRAMVGTLLEVGQGRLSEQGFRQVLESRDRKAAARNVPPEGLFLSDVTYPEEIYILS